MLIAFAHPPAEQHHAHHHARPHRRPRRRWYPAVASWYGPGFYGQPQACGGTFTGQSLTVAHKTIPCGTRLRMCASKCATVTVTDRGPYVAGRDFDLSPATKNAIGMAGGTGRVRYRSAG